MGRVRGIVRQGPRPAARAAGGGRLARRGLARTAQLRMTPAPRPTVFPLIESGTMDDRDQRIADLKRRLHRWRLVACALAVALVSLVAIAGTVGLFMML